MQSSCFANSLQDQNFQFQLPVLALLNNELCAKHLDNSQWTIPIRYQGNVSNLEQALCLSIRRIYQDSNYSNNKQMSFRNLSATIFLTLCSGLFVIQPPQLSCCISLYRPDYLILFLGCALRSTWSYGTTLIIPSLYTFLSCSKSILATLGST